MMHKLNIPLLFLFLGCTSQSPVDKLPGNWKLKKINLFYDSIQNGLGMNLCDSEITYQFESNFIKSLRNADYYGYQLSTDDSNCVHKTKFEDLKWSIINDSTFYMSRLKIGDHLGKEIGGRFGFKFKNEMLMLSKARDTFYFSKLGENE